MNAKDWENNFTQLIGGSKQYEEALDYITGRTWSKTRLGLTRTRELLRRLGDPQKTLKFVHVAGSNGKGSVCALL